MRIPRMLKDELPHPPGRIITFYSYKGGTGRSMTMANVAWILASNGYRVLAIDWDLEAPGLHRYLRPFLLDPELTETAGLIDFFVHFTEAARIQAGQKEKSFSTGRPWFYDRADLTRYAVRLDHEFPEGAAFDFIGAGRQGPSYGMRVNSFQWGEFYEKLGGGVFLEAMKDKLRKQYDYILIDSRTGLSDTSGICTVQMPDELVVCFTLNRQSIFGAAAMARSADGQRRLPTGEQGLRIWPVPTRVELHEKVRLEAARITAKEQFAPLLWHVPLTQRPEYWGGIEILYFPYYAYEEVLATIADAPQQTASLLNSMERLTFRLTGGKVGALAKLPPGDRERLLVQYQTANSSVQTLPRRFFLSYATADRSMRYVEKLAEAIDSRFGPRSAFWSSSVPFGSNLIEALESGLKSADTLIVAIGPHWKTSRGSHREVASAIEQGKAIIPVLLEGARTSDLPPDLRSRRVVQLERSTLDDDLRRFVSQLAQSLPAIQTAVQDIDDPQRGQFGGRSTSGGRRITAEVSEGKHGWFKIEITVEPTNGIPLRGNVEFHLHPTFRPPVVRKYPSKGRASLKISAWGAFTVGAIADEGQTRLELNLAELSKAPKVFRQR
jgi:hypothetical protein